MKNLKKNQLNILLKNLAANMTMATICFSGFSAYATTDSEINSESTVTNQQKANDDYEGYKIVGCTVVDTINDELLKKGIVEGKDYVVTSYKLVDENSIPTVATDKSKFEKAGIYLVNLKGITFSGEVSMQIEIAARPVSPNVKCLIGENVEDLAERVKSVLAVDVITGKELFSDLGCWIIKNSSQIKESSEYKNIPQSLVVSFKPGFKYDKTTGDLVENKDSESATNAKRVYAGSEFIIKAILYKATTSLDEIINN